MIGDLSAKWRSRAACYGSVFAFDNTVDGEVPTARSERLNAAVAVCRTCPVISDCAADIDYDLDEGVRGGKLIWHRQLVHVGPEPKYLNAAPPPPAVSRALPREHGTERGFYQHRNRDDMPACAPCRLARNAADAERAEAKEAS